MNCSGKYIICPTCIIVEGRIAAEGPACIALLLHLRKGLAVHNARTSTPSRATAGSPLLFSRLLDEFSIGSNTRRREDESFSLTIISVPGSHRSSPSTFRDRHTIIYLSSPACLYGVVSIDLSPSLVPD